MTLQLWSRTANSNSNADSTVNLPEVRRRVLNDAARDDGGRCQNATTTRRHRDGGTSTAYTATSYKGSRR